MTPAKRAFDLVVASVLGVLLLPLVAVLAVVIVIRDGRPVFYRSERMTTPDRAFGLLKFRTMLPAEDDTTLTGGDKDERVTDLGRVLRRYRLDEVPQILNVLRGDISLVGPRPPPRRYVELCPEIYGELLMCRPGVTGLASMTVFAHEARILGAATTAEETEALYLRRCLPRKARLDLIYRRHASICFDLVILWQTVFRVARQR